MFTRRKQMMGAVLAGVLLVGGVYAWSNVSQHKTAEFKASENKNNAVTLIEDFEPEEEWLLDKDVKKEIRVKNTTPDPGSGKTADIFVRIQLKEFLEFTDKTEHYADNTRYAVKTDGSFAKFDSQEDAQTYATANKLGSPVQIPTTAFEGAGKWFIPTKGGATHGQYGKYLMTSIGGEGTESIIEAGVDNASADATNKHEDAENGECDYTVQDFTNTSGSDVNGKRDYSTQLQDFPAGGGIETTQDLKDYIKWTIGPNVVLLSDYAEPSEPSSGQWIIASDGWVYWSKPLAFGTTTTDFLKNVTLIQTPKNVTFYYAIHTELEAVDYNEMTTLTGLPDEIKTLWRR